MRRGCLALLLVLLAFGAAACAGPPAPIELAYSVFPTAEGADILVEVHGGSIGDAWFGFGSGPGAPPAVVDRVHSVEARTVEGDRLRIEPFGTSGYRVERPGGGWKISYSLDLSPTGGDDIFYRSSTRGNDYLVLVGSDAWVRVYESSQPLIYSPENRPAGFVADARVSFSLPELPVPWRVATTAREVTPRTFHLDEHPLGSVFALGPFALEDAPDGRVRVARHRDWDVLPGEVTRMVGKLSEALRNRVGPQGPNRPLALLSPMPAPLRPSGGLRTAGMVRGNTMILYAALADQTIADEARLSEAMAVFLGHELFHLYLPSAVPVTRDLSWLSEGWAMHMGRLAASDAGWLTADASQRRLRQAYRRYLEIGGYRAGSLPEASMGSESQRDLLYLRGELVFRLLEAEWQRTHSDVDFEQALWSSLLQAYGGVNPLGSEQVRLYSGGSGRPQHGSPLRRRARSADPGGTGSVSKLRRLSSPLFGLLAALLPTPGCTRIPAPPTPVSDAEELAETLAEIGTPVPIVRLRTDEPGIEIDPSTLRQQALVLTFVAPTAAPRLSNELIDRLAELDTRLQPANRDRTRVILVTLEQEGEPWVVTRAAMARRGIRDRGRSTSQPASASRRGVIPTVSWATRLRWPCCATVW